MQNIFFGTYERKVDSRGRLWLPAEFKEALKDKKAIFSVDYNFYKDFSLAAEIDLTKIKKHKTCDRNRITLDKKDCMAIIKGQGDFFTVDFIYKTIILTKQFLKDRGYREDAILFFETNNLTNKSIVSVFDYCIDKERPNYARWLLYDFKDNKEFATTERLIECYNGLIRMKESSCAKWLLSDFKDNKEFVNAVKNK